MYYYIPSFSLDAPDDLRVSEKYQRYTIQPRIVCSNHSFRGCMSLTKLNSAIDNNKDGRAGEALVNLYYLTSANLAQITAPPVFAVSAGAV